MGAWTWFGTEQVVPEMNAQDEEGGTLILRPGQSYDWDDEQVKPGDPDFWWPVSPKLPPPVLPVAKTDAPVADNAGG